VVFKKKFIVRQPVMDQILLIVKASRWHSFIYTTLNRIPLHEWSDQFRDLYLRKHNNHKWQISMPTAGFELPIPGSDRPQTHASDRAATGNGGIYKYFCFKL